MYLDTAVDAMLKGHGEQVYCMQVNILDSFLSLVLVILLLPRFGLAGYLFTVYLTELLNAALSVTRLLSVTQLRLPFFSGVLLPLTAVIGATSVVRLLGGLGFLGGSVEVPMLVVLSALLYLVLLLMLGAANVDELRRLKGAIRRKKCRSS
jgi:stage V sporulation protein B